MNLDELAHDLTIAPTHANILAALRAARHDAFRDCIALLLAALPDAEAPILIQTRETMIAGEQKAKQS